MERNYSECHPITIYPKDLIIGQVKDYSFLPVPYHHHVVLPAQISLTLSRRPSLSSVAPSRSSRLHPVLPQSCCIQVLPGRPAFAHPCERVHRSTSLMSLSPLFLQCPACLAHLTWIFLVMGGRWPYSICFVGCCLQD